MTFKQLRSLLEKGPLAIEWQKSGIVEVAKLAPNGAVRVINVVSQREYSIPRGYNELNIKIIGWNDLVPLGKFLPKRR